jgi:hypothetical protein
MVPHMQKKAITPEDTPIHVYVMFWIVCTIIIEAVTRRKEDHMNICRKLEFFLVIQFNMFNLVILTIVLGFCKVD